MGVPQHDRAVAGLELENLLIKGCRFGRFLEAFGGERCHLLHHYDARGALEARQLHLVQVVELGPSPTLLVKLGQCIAGLTVARCDFEQVFERLSRVLHVRKLLEPAAPRRP